MDRLPIGTKWVVGEFFWTKEDDCIGFSPDASHGHNLSFGGSVAAGDEVVILGHEPNGMAVVKVLKSMKPYGAPCPHGMIFMIPEGQIRRWPVHIDRSLAVQKRRRELAEKYLPDQGAVMTSKLEALRALHDAVKEGNLCVVPSPYEAQRENGTTARIMVYAEGYVMMRHKGAMPFVYPVPDLLAILSALIAQEEAA